MVLLDKMVITKQLKDRLNGERRAVKVKQKTPTLTRGSTTHLRSEILTESSLVNLSKFLARPENQKPRLKQRKLKRKNPNFFTKVPQKVKLNF